MACDESSPSTQLTLREKVFFLFSPKSFFFFFLMTFLKHLIFWAKSQMIHSLPSCRAVADFQSRGKDSLWNKCKVGSEAGKCEKMPYYSSQVLPGGMEPSRSRSLPGAQAFRNHEMQKPGDLRAARHSPQLGSTHEYKFKKSIPLWVKVEY